MRYSDYLSFKDKVRYYLNENLIAASLLGASAIKGRKSISTTGGTVRDSKREPLFFGRKELEHAEKLFAELSDINPRAGSDWEKNKIEHFQPKLEKFLKMYPESKRATELKQKFDEVKKIFEKKNKNKEKKENK
jgi:hypothetical protein